MADFERVKWAVSHDPYKAGDRMPSGAVPAGTIVHFTLRVEPEARGAVHHAVVMTGERTGNGSTLIWSESALTASSEGYSGFLAIDAAPHVVFYVFRLHLADGGITYYVPRVDGRATAGELVCPGLDGQWTPRGWVFSEERMKERPSGGFGLAEVLPGFQVTVYEPAFSTPSWMQGAILYQIFPDRFARGPLGVSEDGLRYHQKMGRPVRLHESWSELVEWQEGNADKPTFDPIDFFGGRFDGIRRKLPYIASLGVEAIYLNPIVEARSNHRYDTADYEHVDPLLGTDEDFQQLTKEAAELGIRIVLDAVLSHTGDDSRYFNALGNYDELGAAQGGKSPYFKWFDFECISGHVPYRCWWGDPTLPEVNERDLSWQNYILGEGGVLERWLKAGAGGYRLDVADEIPDDVLERLRTCVKAIDPQAAIIGEVWEDATSKESYGTPRTYALGSALDSVMNYPLRSALLGFALGTIDAHQLATFLRLQQINYPPQLHACLMNLLSSHDVERVRSALALNGPVKHLAREEQLKLVESITPEQDEIATGLQRMIVALLYALPGMPSIYYGDERGLQSGGDPFCRATFPWPEEGSLPRADCGRDLTGFYQELGQLRKGTPELRTGAFACAAPSEDVLCVIRIREDEGITVAATNRGAKPSTVAFDASSPNLGLPAGCRWDVRHVANVRQVFTTAPTEDDASFDNEDGIICVTVPACSTVLWQADIAE